MDIDYSSMRNAIESMCNAIDVYDEVNSKQKDNTNLLRVIQAGAIHNFEFTYELCWKFMRRWIENNVGTGITLGISRRELFRRSAENGLITDINICMDFHECRNQTSHIYDSKVAEEVFKTVVGFLPYVKDLLMRLEKKDREK